MFQNLKLVSHKPHIAFAKELIFETDFLQKVNIEDLEGLLKGFSGKILQSGSLLKFRASKDALFRSTYLEVFYQKCVLNRGLFWQALQLYYKPSTGVFLFSRTDSAAISVS